MSSRLVPSTVRRATSMSTCREIDRNPESAEAMSPRPARVSQARTRRARSASASTSLSARPEPRSQSNTRSQFVENTGTDSGSRMSTSGSTGGGQITHTPARRASASRSLDAGAASRTQLKPRAATASSGSPLWSSARGKNGSAPTSRMPRLIPLAVSSGAGGGGAAGGADGGAACGGAVGGATNCAGCTAGSPRVGGGAVVVSAGGGAAAVSVVMLPSTSRSSIATS